MASALSANNPSATTNPTAYLNVPVYTNVHIYQGARVCVNSSGYAVPAADTSGYVYIGIALNEVNNTGASGAANVQVQPAGGFETLAINSTASQATVGVHVFLVNDQACDIAGNSTNKVAYGTVNGFISSGYVLVNTAARFTNATAA